MRRWVAAWIVAVAALFAPMAGASGAGPQPPSGIIGEDDRQLLDPVSWPWFAIGRVNREAGGFCTGTLVAPDLVLTARHCLFHARTGRRFEPGTIHFLAGYRRGEWRAHGIGRAFVLPTPQLEYGAALLAKDWAFVALENALDVEPVPLLALPEGSAAETRLARAGYARDRPHLLSLHDGCILLGRDGNLLFHDCDATYGESGSPLLVLKGDEAFIVGITTGAGSASGRNVGLAIDARAFVDWIGRPPPVSHE